MKNYKKKFFILASLSMLVLSFQNCARNEFTQGNSPSENKTYLTPPAINDVKSFKVVIDELPMIGPDGSLITKEISAQKTLDSNDARETFLVRQTTVFLKGKHEETCFNEYILNESDLRPTLQTLNEVRINIFDPNKDPDISIADAAIYSIYINAVSEKAETANKESFRDGNQIRLGNRNLRSGMKYTTDISFQEIEKLISKKELKNQSCKVTIQ